MAKLIIASPRRVRNVSGMWPTCERCGKTLPRKRKRWCSRSCGADWWIRRERLDFDWWRYWRKWQAERVG